MNNGTKQANIMTWSKFKKLFEPKLYSTTNFLGGKQIVQPTLTKMGFLEKFVWDISIFETKKPLELVKENINVFKYTYIIYYPFKYRDGSGKGIQIYYK